jgi:hypothetical protein
MTKNEKPGRRATIFQKQDAQTTSQNTKQQQPTQANELQPPLT